MKSKKPDDRRVVYSTDTRPLPRCERCGEATCRCTDALGAAKGELRARVQREKGGRGGKLVTVIYELGLPEPALRELCGRLKKRCASGGTVKDGTIEIQGDHAERVIEMLASEGFRARRSGG